MLGEGSYAQVFKVDLRQERQPGCVSEHIYTIIIKFIFCKLTLY